MKKEMTAEQRAAQHISAKCPACGHEILMGASRYDGIHIGSHEVCPWCETMLIVTSLTVACAVDVKEEAPVVEQPATAAEVL